MAQILQDDIPDPEEKYPEYHQLMSSYLNKSNHPLCYVYEQSFRFKHNTPTSRALMSWCRKLELALAKDPTAIIPISSSVKEILTDWRDILETMQPYIFPEEIEQINVLEAYF